MKALIVHHSRACSIVQLLPFTFDIADLDVHGAIVRSCSHPLQDALQNHPITCASICVVVRSLQQASVRAPRTVDSMVSFLGRPLEATKSMYHCQS